MVKDIYPGERNGASGEDIINLNGTLYFIGDNGVDGAELWMTDGTGSNTVMVKDINPDSGSSPTFLTKVNNTIYFRANDGSGGYQQLWKSDGTGFGTVMVKDIYPGGSSLLGHLTNVDGLLYFRADDGTNGRELWMSDGTEFGTVMVKDINPGGASSTGELTNVNGVLYFSANDGINGTELWTSDGTEFGTVMIKDIRSDGNGDPSWITDVSGTAYFFANDGINGSELWKSDGTEFGTVMVKDINPSGSGIQGQSADALANINGTLYFCADDGIHGSELWKTDGTEFGTVMLKDLNPGGDGYPGNFTDVNGVLYFRARSTDPDFFGDNTLWVSDGTANGTDMVPNFSGHGLGSLTNVDGSLYFTAYDGEHGNELWVMFTNVIFADGFESGNTSAW